MHAIEPVLLRQRLKARHLEEESPRTRTAIQGAIDPNPIGQLRHETSAHIRRKSDIRVLVVFLSERRHEAGNIVPAAANLGHGVEEVEPHAHSDRKSTRLNSSQLGVSY